MIFGRPFVKRFALCHRSVVCPVLSVCPVCAFAVLWPNGSMDQDESWHRGRPRHRPHCVRWRPSSPIQNGQIPQFSAHVRCDQTAGWIKMPLRRQVGLGPDNIVLVLDHLRSLKGGTTPNFRPMSIASKRPDGSRYPLLDQDAT